jgi:hypothetical protein
MHVVLYLKDAAGRPGPRTVTEVENDQYTVLEEIIEGK